ncbi:hypothetical protein [Acetobacter sp. DsW_063]|uniref:hypothetical protein n=1 Tax=Acetobacter sp. DsW_063 TaxID=1514894 RepID=UPI000A3B5461|nr:hypothetical protein [Acetobacter sp. DsW_063]OUJ14531.1 hypothetical protein HK28_13005 [Acetobacter sp. DsW_063]
MEQGSVAHRGLLAAVIGMGAMIVVGTVVLLVVVAHRLSHPTRPATAQSLSASLHEPEGSHIAGITWRDGDTLAVQLTGGGPDRVILWDVPHGREVGRVSIQP